MRSSQVPEVDPVALGYWADPRKFVIFLRIQTPESLSDPLIKGKKGRFGYKSSKISSIDERFIWLAGIARNGDALVRSANHFFLQSGFPVQRALV